MGVVYHPNYIIYFEMGRTELMRDAGFAYAEVEKMGLRLVVTETGCRHRAVAKYDESLSVHTRIQEIGRVRLRFGYRIIRGDTLVAEGYTELACLDEKNKLVRLPREITDRLKGWIAFPRPE